MSPRTAIFDAKVDPVTAKKLRTTMSLIPKTMGEELNKDMTNWGNAWLRLMSKQFRPTAAGGGSDSRLSNRSNRLRNSLKKLVRGGTKLSAVNLRVFSAGVPHADVQELGGTIKSTRPGGYLTIPLDPMKTKAGVTRMSARRLIETEGGLTRDGGNAFFYRSDAGNLLLARYKGKRKRVENLFWLTKSVTIPGPRTGGRSRLGFFRNWDRLAKSRRTDLQTLGARALARADRGGA